MLERTLRLEFEPGGDRRGDAAGAGWSFALPSLRIDRVLMVGAVGDDARRRVAGMTDQIEAIDADALAHDGIVGRAPSARADLVVIGHDVDLGHHGVGGLASAIAPGGLLYEEDGPSEHGAPLVRALEDAGMVKVLELALAPSDGDAVAIVPSGDRAVLRFFEREGLDRPGTTVPGAPAARPAGRWRRGRLWQPSAAHVVPGVGVPRYISELAVRSGIDLSTWRYGLWARGEYGSQKLIFFLFRARARQPELVVKVTRAAEFNERLENERAALDRVHELEGFEASAPDVAFFGHHGGLAVLGLTVVPGWPFVLRTSGRPDCPFARHALEGLIGLGAATRRPADPGEVAASLREVVAKFAALYDPEPDLRGFLDRQVETVAACPVPIPLVLQHGNAAPWNIIVAPRGSPAFLDWEFSEREGVPLWDLFYFLHTYARLRPRRARGRRKPASSDLFAEPWASLLVRSTHDYAARVGVPREVVVPLLHLCWMHLTLNEATHLGREELAVAPWLAVLRRSIGPDGSPVVAALAPVSAGRR